VAVGVLGLASCGEIVEPEPFTIATSTTVVAESGASSVEAPAAPLSPNPPVTSDFVPSPPADYRAELLVSTRQGVLAADSTGVVRPLAEPFAGISTTRAVDDLLGGLVFEDAPTGEVVWLSATGDQRTLVDGEETRLLDVGYVEGSPYAFVLVGDAQVDQIRLVDQQRIPLVALDEGREVLALSTSGPLHVLAVADEECGDLRFYSADGSSVDLEAPSVVSCPVPRRPTYGAVALSPDGGAMAYTRVTYRDDGLETQTVLVARELSTGIDYYRTTIGAEGDRISSLSFDGERVAFLRHGADGTASVAVIDLRGGVGEVIIDLQNATATLVDSISFARLPLAQG
jgi:hypothetical protein